MEGDWLIEGDNDVDGLIEVEVNGEYELNVYAPFNDDLPLNFGYVIVAATTLEDETDGDDVIGNASAIGKLVGALTNPAFCNAPVTFDT